MLTVKFVFCSTNSLRNCLKPLCIRHINRTSVRNFHRQNATLYCIPPNQAKENHDLNNVSKFSDSNVNNTTDINIGQASANKENLGAKPANIEYRVVKENEVVGYQKMASLHPAPKNVLHNIYVAVAQELKKSDVLTSHSETIGKKHPMFSFTYSVSWPENLKFVGIGKNKSGAATVAALKCLQWLHNNHKIRDKKPVLYEYKEIQKKLYEPIEVKVRPEHLVEAEMLIESYEHGLKDTVENEKPVEESVSAPPEEEHENLVRINPMSINMSDKQLSVRNAELYRSLLSREVKSDTSLPIFKYKEQIIKELENNQTLLIKGDTGCGKTTQVPQFIMDSFIQQHKGVDCNILVSQPRRISAMSLAERVAHERNEAVGDVVGYHVRLDNMLPKLPGQMIFCTTGILFRKLQYNPDLTGYSHVIVDEAHERGITTDMTLVLLKRLVQRNPKLKVVVMSATINADLFQKYLNCSVIEVPGRLYPVKMHFSDDMPDILQSRNNNQGLLRVNCEDVANTVRWISRNKGPGAILCFLPGWSEIVAVQTLLERKSVLHENQVILPLHSKMSHFDQRKIFSSVPRGYRKIILATDIAETGITVTDVVYVVDSAIRKELHYDAQMGVSSMRSIRISRANLDQRKGRAGRVQPGESYHLISKNEYDMLHEYPVPEVLRIPLERTILDVKLHTPEKIDEFLQSMPEPPKKDTVNSAIDNLRKLDILDEEENLTPLGERVAKIVMYPTIGKALVYSAIFRCLNPIMTIANAFSTDNEVSNVLSEKDSFREIKKQYHSTSDHYALYLIYKHWEKYENEMRDTKTLCQNLLVHPGKLKTLRKLQELSIDYLTESKMLSKNVTTYSDSKHPVNRNSSHDELVAAVLFSATDHLLQKKDYDVRNGHISANSISLRDTENFRRVALTPHSVNYKNREWPTPFLTFLQQLHSEERRTVLIRETSMLSPLSVLLFNPHGVQYDTSGDDTGKVTLTLTGRNVYLTCDKEVSDVLLKFRSVMWNIVNYIVKTEGTVGSHESRVIREFRDTMVDTILRMLQSKPNPKIEQHKETQR